MSRMVISTRTLVIGALLAQPMLRAYGQVCYGGMCYPQQPTAAARLVMPLESAADLPHDAHCRIDVGDGTLGSGTLISKNDTTGLVLTCSHLFDDASPDIPSAALAPPNRPPSPAARGIIVSFPNGSRFAARLIDRDPANDLAALLIQRPNVEPVAVDDSEPKGVLTACGYGGNGRFRPASGAVAGAVQTVGATFPSLKIGSAVRPGDSGGGVLDRAGRLVGVVWGCRDGETYLTCGRPLRQFLDRVWQGRHEQASTPAPASPTVDWQAWRDAIESRLAALDTKKQDRGQYLQVGDLNAYAKKSDIGATVAAESQHAIEQVERSSTSQIESLRTAVFDRIEQRVGATSPGFLSGMSYGKLAVQSAIALIRKHRGVSRSGVEQFVAAGADATATATNGRTRHFSQYGPGTILDAPAGLEYDFPTAGIDAGSFVTVQQAELRAIAARLVMPEFMFTSDASNSNFASTMVAEGPAVRMFERLQAGMIESDRAMMWRVVENAIHSGQLPADVRENIEIQITGPTLRVRDHLREAQVDRIAYTHGVLSPQTWSQHLGLDYDQEQKNLAEHAERG